MGWQPRRQGPAKWAPTRPRRASGRRRFPFWAGWLALVAGACLFQLVVSSPALRLPTGQGAGYQCGYDAYNCSDFRTRLEAQTAFRACGGRRNDVHRLDEDGDGFACERMPLLMGGR
jgi:Excalibur calcium-binding domain